MKTVFGIALLLVPWPFIGMLKYGGIMPPYALYFMLIGSVLSGIALTTGLILVQRRPRGKKESRSKRD